MTHIRTRAQLWAHVAKTTNDSTIRNNLNHGQTTLWGRFVGGWVLETSKRGQYEPPPAGVIVGVKPSGTVGQDLISGRLSGVPWADYLGGETEIDKGDYPEIALKNKKESEK